MKTALVTGASRGIGAHIAAKLAVDGYTVFAGMRKPMATLRDVANGDIRPIRLDVTALPDIHNAVTEIVDQFGRLDLLINNAGVAWFAPAEEMSETVLRTTMETNFFGAVRCTQAALPYMRKQGFGTVIMISTIAAATGLPLESAYCASKSALEAFSESLRLEVNRFGIKVAVIEPGITEGGLSNSVADPQPPTDSAYGPLTEHTFNFYNAAQDALESPDLITAAINEILTEPQPAFRHRLGQFGPLIEQVLMAPEPEGTKALLNELQIGWWYDPADQVSQ